MWILKFCIVNAFCFEYTGVQGSDGVFKAQKLFDQWQICYPDVKRDPISVWDDVVLNRYVCLFDQWQVCYLDAKKDPISI